MTNLVRQCAMQLGLAFVLDDHCKIAVWQVSKANTIGDTIVLVNSELTEENAYFGGNRIWPSGMVECALKAIPRENLLSNVSAVLASSRHIHPRWCAAWLSSTKRRRVYSWKLLCN